MQHIPGNRIHQVTQALFVSGFPEDDSLRAAGITHVLDVCEHPPDYGDQVVRSIHLPVEDLTPLPGERLRKCLDALHAMVIEEESRCLVHCTAGQNRSPTVLWFYLIACGVEPAQAEFLIADASFDSIPGHPMLVTPELLPMVVAHGRERFLPHARSEALEPGP